MSTMREKRNAGAVDSVPKDEAEKGMLANTCNLEQPFSSQNAQRSKEVEFNGLQNLKSSNMSEPEHFRTTYNDVHNLIKNAAPKIAEFKPDLFIAIGASSPFPPFSILIFASRWRVSERDPLCVRLIA